MKKLALLLFLIAFTTAQAQLNKTIIGKWKLNCTIFTEFTTTDMANKQVTDNQAKYSYLENSAWTFKSDGKFEVKLSNGAIEKGGYSANEDRFIIIFDKKEIEEFNTALITVEAAKVSLSMGRGMTKLVFNFSKK